MCGRARKQLNINLMFPKTKRFSWNSVLPQIRIKKVLYHLRTSMSIWWTYLGKPKAAFEKQSSVSCKKPKPNYFWNRFSFATRSVLYLRIPLTFHEQSERAQVRYSKASKRLSSKSEDRNTFWKCHSFTNHEENVVFDFSLFHVKIDVKVSVTQKINICREIRVSFSEPKKALLSENVLRLQNQIERCL